VGSRHRIAFVAALLAGLMFAATASAATITVTTTADETITSDAPSVSLREAIISIDNHADTGADVTANRVGTYEINDTIDFNIAGSGRHTIFPGTSSSVGGLPTVTKPMLIDGTSQPGSSVNTLVNADNAETLILLSGVSAGSNASGLFLGSGSAGSTIKGLDVFGFGGADISIQSSSNTIEGDDAGFDLGGAAAISPHGVLILDAGNNLIGGTAPTARNLISGNFLDGVEILSVGLPATGNTVAGNFIGTGATGTSALGNGAAAPAGAGGGVQLIGADSNTIGGTTSGARNVISGNGVAGILDNGAQSNLFEGNFLGVGADGVTAVPNAAGVWLTSANAPAPAAKNNLVGGTVAGSGNLIEFNSGAGVIVSGAASVGDGILGDSTMGNGGLGIDLGNDGVTPNSPGGPHTGPNNLQNFPLITAVSPGQSTTTVQGTLNSKPSTIFRLEFYSNAACDPSGSGQGRTFLGFANVTTDGSGTAGFSATLPEVVPAGTSVAATATDPANDTSEFSRCFPPLAMPMLAVTTTTTTTTTTTSGPTSPPARTVTPRVTLSAKVGKDGSITLSGTTTVAGKASGSGRLGRKGSVAASKRHKTPPALFGPVTKTVAAGAFSLKLKPNSTALTQLRAGKRLTVLVKFTLSPAAGGNALSGSAKVSDRLPRRHRARR
jgi:hypothetical protein